MPLTRRLFIQAAAAIPVATLGMIVAVTDHLAVTDLAIKAYGQAYEPKKLVLLPGGHFDAYVEEFDQACQPSCEWFTAHLLTKNLRQ